MRSWPAYGTGMLAFIFGPAWVISQDAPLVVTLISAIGVIVTGGALMLLGGPRLQFRRRR